MTAVNDIIEKGDAIADDVTAFSAAEGERAMRATNATESGGPWLSAACTFQCIGHFAHEFAFPLTVTAVREQPAEPEPVDVLDLVRQYGYEGYQGGFASAQGDEDTDDHHDGKARRLYDRIEAEVNRLRAEAEADATGDLAAQRDEALADLADARAECDAVRRARDFLTEKVVKPAREALTAVGIDGGVRIADRILLLANERDQALTDVERLRWLLDTQAKNFSAAYNKLAEATPSADPSDPLVLSLPTVPDGAVALIGGKTGWTYRLWSTPEWGLWHSDDPEGGTEPGKLGALLDGEGSVTVVMREPRTWPKLDAPDASAVRGASGRIWRRVSPTVWACNDDEGGEECENFSALQQYDGPLVEVFDDKDSTR